MEEATGPQSETRRSPMHVYHRSRRMPKRSLRSGNTCGLRRGEIGAEKQIRHFILPDNAPGRLEASGEITEREVI
jgi:hypothetical protein